ncbi:10180_t:CDS:2, partial [Acaulospora morrowiae]
VENRITAKLSAIKRSRRNSSANTELLQKINDLDHNISLMGYKVREIKMVLTVATVIPALGGPSILILLIDNERELDKEVEEEESSDSAGPSRTRK